MPTLISPTQQAIINEAAAQGVPPAIALAVAQKESSFNPGAVGAAGEIGLFQLMPKTADALGVDPADVGQNISGGISFLAQLYAQYGNWPAALSAYNSGSPTGSPTYAASVLSISSNYAGVVPPTPSDSSTVDFFSGMFSGGDSSSFSLDPNFLVVGGIVAVLVAAWWWAD